LALAGPKTFAVVVGVLSFGSPTVAGWSKDQRKDRELYQKLRARGVPSANMELLLDEKASQAAVQAALVRIGARAGAGSTLLFYYAGHGARDAAGRPYFLAYDTTGFDTGIAMDALGETVRDHFAGARVMFMADACYSGALSQAVETVAKAGKVKAASLTSADASNLSTNNWTFTQTVIDGLDGDALMDADADGRVSLGELSAAVGDAMKYREKQKHGFTTEGVDDEALIVADAKGQPAVGTGKVEPGRYVMAPRDGHRDVAQIRGGSGNVRRVRFYDYNHAVDREVPRAQLRPITFERHPAGSKLRVYWGGKVWDAEVVKTDGDFHFITYPGYGPEWNEWVMSDRIARPSAKGGSGDGDDAARGEAVEVEWRGSWWPAQILDQASDRYLIHYVGYGSDWDEWVTDARIRREGARRAD